MAREWDFAATLEADELVTMLITKYDQGIEELGQAQFAALLQDVLQDMDASLAEKPITIVRDVKLLNGLHLRKVVKLANTCTWLTAIECCFLYTWVIVFW